MSTMHDKQAELINALIKSSEKNKLKWQKWEDGENCYYAEVNGKIIYISSVKFSETNSILLEIYSMGELADSFVDDDLSSADVEPVWGQNWFHAMTSLLNHAKRQSTGADEVIDSILRDLRN